ncbi:AAA family ATPase [Streptomyces sp. NRRL B-3229]|uniref:AAA family ATPase n=1 Tax=Streptomyces sp. NRRL B-3229 TaxID=1463836 RepID=UPI0007C4A2DB|nr:AAA family ATPase [Streptomyces sp. NRRL B-3229]
MTGSASGEDGAAPQGPAPAHALMPLWAVSLGWEMERGRQVVVSGQIRDRWWFDGRPAPFRELMVNVLVGRGAEVVGWWDPVDGLTFPVPGHRERFDTLSAALPADAEAPGDAPAPSGDWSASATAASGGSSVSANVNRTGAAADPGDDGPSQDGTRRATARRTAAAGLLQPRPPRRLVSLEDATAQARRLAAQSSAATAFVFEDVDHALPVADPASAQGYLRLRAAMADAIPPTTAASGSRARNAMLVAVGDLSRLPGWFWQEDPRIASLPIGPPDQAERRLWLSLLRQDFRGHESATRHDVEALIGATDGMAGWELDALARTSHLRRVEMGRPDRLMQAHRLNVSVDPWSQLDRTVMGQAAQTLKSSVIGQQVAVDAVAAALQAAFVGLDFGESGAARPRGSFFFVGPTGVGKTELAKAVAKLIFGDPTAYARFDMSEYQQEHAAERLAGAPPGFVGYDQGGELTRRVQERPFSVLLFDEIEKAHPAVLDKFLQVLEDGRLTDGRGQTAYFSQSLIIFTSNTGTEALSGLLAAEQGDGPSYDALRQHFSRAVEEKFRAIGRPEIFGRLKPGVVVFDMLRAQHVAGITDRLLDQLAASAHERNQVEVVFDRAGVHAWITARMALPEQRAYGGRQIRNELELLRSALVAHLLSHSPPPGSRVEVGLDLTGQVRVSPAGDRGPGGAGALGGRASPPAVRVPPTSDSV